MCRWAWNKNKKRWCNIYTQSHYQHVPQILTPLVVSNWNTQNARILEVHALLDSKTEVHKMHKCETTDTHFAFYSRRNSLQLNIRQSRRFQELASTNTEKRHPYILIQGYQEFPIFSPMILHKLTWRKQLTDHHSGFLN